MMLDLSNLPLSPKVTLYLHAHVDGALLLVKFRTDGTLWVRYVPDTLEEQRLFSLPKGLPPKMMGSYFGDRLFRRQNPGRMDWKLLPTSSVHTVWLGDYAAEYQSLQTGWLLDNTLVPQPRAVGKHYGL